MPSLTRQLTRQRTPVQGRSDINFVKPSHGLPLRKRKLSLSPLTAPAVPRGRTGLAVTEAVQVVVGGCPDPGVVAGRRPGADLHQVGGRVGDVQPVAAVVGCAP
jgi:hypothetical protein